MSQYDQLHIEDYNYPLPEDRIAKYPLPRRDASKLLIYRLGEVSSAVFRDLPEYLPVDASLVFNETKVVPARLHFRRQSGAVIEIFCLEPVLPTDYNQSFACTQTCRWRCVIGNAKRWKGDTISLINTLDDSHLSLINLRANLIERSGQTGIVEFIWDSGVSFSEVLDLCGKIPIPPYLGRETEDIDLERYQTTYARLRGSVAAPTAGLHFTPEVLEEVRARGIALEGRRLYSFIYSRMAFLVYPASAIIFRKAIITFWESLAVIKRGWSAPVILLMNLYKALSDLSRATRSHIPLM